MNIFTSKDIVVLIAHLCRDNKPFNGDQQQLGVEHAVDVRDVSHTLRPVAAAMLNIALVLLRGWEVMA